MKLRSTILFFTLCSLVLGSMAGCSSKEDREKKYVERARVLIEQGDLTKAGLEISNVLQINSTNAEALYLRGLIHEENKNFSKMMDSYNAAIAADPGYVPAQEKLAGFYFAYGTQADDVTKNTIDQILAVDPENQLALYFMGRMALRQGDLEEAKRIAHKASSLDPKSVRPYQLRAEIFADDEQKALEAIEDGLAVLPDNVDLLVSKARLFDRQGNWSAAANVFAELSKLYPDDLTYFENLLSYLEKQEDHLQIETLLNQRIAEFPEVSHYRTLLARQLVNTNQSDKAIATLKGFIAEDPTVPTYHYLLSDLYLSQENTGMALTVLQEYQETLDKDSPEILQAINRSAEIVLRQGDTATARRYLEEALEINPGDPEALIMSARLDLADNKSTEAILKLRTAMRSAGDSPEALILLARAHELDGATELALENYQQAINLQPGNIDTVMRVARMYYDRNEPALADRLLLRYIGVEQTARTVAPPLVTSLVKQGDWAEALEVADTLESQASNRSLGQYLKGGILYEQSKYQEAQSVFEGLLESEPGSERLIAAIVKTQNAWKGPEAAVNYLLGYIDENPEELAPIEKLASLYIEQGEVDKALETYQLALKVAPENPNLYLQISSIHQRVGNESDAIDAINQAVNLAPNNAGLLILKAGLLESMADYEGAAEVYELVLEKNPGNAIASNNLAMLLVDQLRSDKNVEKALSITDDFEAATEPVFLDTRGWVLYRAGNYSRAVDLLEKAVADNNEVSAVYRYHLGMAYLGLNRPDEARLHLQAAIQSGQTFYGLEEAKNILDVD